MFAPVSYTHLLKRYRFFDIGTDHYYYDDYENDRSINEIAGSHFLPGNLVYFFLAFL